MSRLVRHFLMATPSVEAGSAEYWTNGTVHFTVPPVFNQLRIRMTGAGGGGARTDGQVGGAGGGYGTAGSDSRIDALGLKATGGQGRQAQYSGGVGGVGTGGDVNGTGTTGYTTSSPTRGVPLPSLSMSGYGAESGGGGGGYVEKTFTIGDPAVLPNSVIEIVLGKAGQNSITAQGFGQDGGCVIEWY